MKELATFLQPDGTYRYRINAPDMVADREERPHYEKDRFASMEANLRRGDILFDVGAELGWQSAIYAQFVGPENMCLFEHASAFWPTIRETWELNQYATPKITFCGFVGHRSAGMLIPGAIQVADWPCASGGETLTPLPNDIREALTNSSGCETALDDVWGMTGITPSAITIDVEGAELRVLQGCRRVLLEYYRPLVWVSIHPEIRLASYGATKQAVHDLMHDAGYAEQYLGVDHEEHFFFFPQERADDVKLVDSPWMTYGNRQKSFEEVMPNWTDQEGMPYTSAWGSEPSGQELHSESH